jgi:hypothetical protein
MRVPAPNNEENPSRSISIPLPTLRGFLTDHKEWTGRAAAWCTLEFRLLEPSRTCQGGFHGICARKMMRMNPGFELWRVDTITE